MTQFIKTLFVLIGPPAVGKSTWVKNHAPTAKVVSRDDVIERVSAKHGLTYDDAYVAPSEQAELGQVVAGMERFGPVVPSDLTWRKLDFQLPQLVHREANAELASAVKAHANDEHDVVLDMTNMDKASRALYMTPFGNDFHKVAVVFNFHDDTLVSTIKKRARERGDELRKQGRPKTISPEVIDRMISAYQVPEASEGFDEIIPYNTPIDKIQESDTKEVVSLVRRIIRQISGK